MDSIVEVNLSLDDACAAFEDAVLNHIRAAGDDDVDGPLNAAKINALQEQVESPRDLTADAVSPADYDGNGQQTITWEAAARDEANDSYIVSGLMTFVPSGDDTIGSNTLAAIGVYDAAGTTLILAKNLPAPVVVSPGVPLRVVVTFSGRPVASQG